MGNLSIDRIVFLTITVISFIAGSYFQQLRDDKDELNRIKQLKELEIKQNKIINDLSNKVLNGVKEWENNKELVIKEIYHEKSLPVFNNICISDKYYILFNETQDQSRKILTNQSSTKLSN